MGIWYKKRSAELSKTIKARIRKLHDEIVDIVLGYNPNKNYKDGLFYINNRIILYRKAKRIRELEAVLRKLK